MLSGSQPPSPSPPPANQRTCKDIGESCYFGGRLVPDAVVRDDEPYTYDICCKLVAAPQLVITLDTAGSCDDSIAKRAADGFKMTLWPKINENLISLVAIAAKCAVRRIPARCKSMFYEKGCRATLSGLVTRLMCGVSSPHRGNQSAIDHWRMGSGGRSLTT